MENGNGNGFLNGEIIYGLKRYKSWLAVKDEENSDIGNFKCAVCILRHNLFNFIKRNYSEIFEKMSSLLEEQGYEAEDIDIGKGIDDPIDNEFYFCVIFQRECRKLEIKISLYIQTDKEKDFLIINTSVNAELNCADPITSTVTMTGIRNIFWRVSNWVNAYCTDILQIKAWSGYSIELLTAGSNKLNRKLVINLSKQKTADEVPPKIRDEVCDGYRLLNKLITRERRFSPYRFSWRMSSSVYDGEEVTYLGLKQNKSCMVIIAGTDNPIFSHKNTERMIKDELFGLR